MHDFDQCLVLILILVLENVHFNFLFVVECAVQNTSSH